MTTALSRAQEALHRIVHSPQGGTLLPEQADALERHIEELEAQAAHERGVGIRNVQYLEQVVAEKDKRIATLSAACGAAGEFTR